MISAIARWEWTSDGPMTGWAAPSGSVACPDLRAVPDCGLAGDYGDWPWSVFIFDDSADIPGDAFTLGEGRFDELRPSEAARTRWGECFGATPDGDTLADWYWWQLTDGAVPDGYAPCKPIMPTHLRVCELWLPKHSLVRAEKFGTFDPSKPYHNRVQDLLQQDFRQLLTDCDNERAAIDNARKKLAKDKSGGQKEKTERAKKDAWYAKRDEALAELPSKVLGGHLLKYRGLTAADISRDVDARKPTTAISDDFNRANETLTDGPWTVNTGTWNVTSNLCRCSTGGASAPYAAHTTALSSADMYSQCLGVNSTNYGGAATRVKTSSTANCYTLITNANNGWLLRKYSGTSSSSTTTIDSAAGTDHRNKTYYLSSSGSTHVGKINGSQVTSSTDTTYSSPNYAGLFIYLVTTGDLDDFDAADLLAPGNPKNVLRGPLSGPMKRVVVL